jgi:hypothetical protein
LHASPASRVPVERRPPGHPAHDPNGASMNTAGWTIAVIAILTAGATARRELERRR